MEQYYKPALLGFTAPAPIRETINKPNFIIITPTLFFIFERSGTINEIVYPATPENNIRKKLEINNEVKVGVAPTRVALHMLYYNIGHLKSQD
ncbi:MAG: hypothetical protein K2J32_09025 [Ruminococcus sp.]|nr:hypothetical protein [Ruminococcus sp.]